MKKFSTRSIVLGALLAACALLVSFIESLFPLPLPLPGAKLGLSNITVLLALLLLDGRTAFFVLAVKVLLGALLFGTPISLLYAAVGGSLSFAAMAALNARRGVSPIGQSIAGAALHNLGQVLVAAALTATPRLLLYYTPLALLALLTGSLSGFLAQLCARSLRRLPFHSG